MKQTNLSSFANFLCDNKEKVIVLARTVGDQINLPTYYYNQIRILDQYIHNHYSMIGYFHCCNNHLPPLNIDNREYNMKDYLKEFHHGLTHTQTKIHNNKDCYFKKYSIWCKNQRSTGLISNLGHVNLLNYCAIYTFCRKFPGHRNFT